MRLPLNTGRACVENRGSHPYMVGSQNGRLPRAVEAHPPQPASKSKKRGVPHGVLGACVFGVINAGNVKNGIGVPERRGAALRSQSGEAAGPVVGGLEAPWAHPGGGARGVREVCNAGAFRARRRGRRLQCYGPAGGLLCREPLPQDRFPNGTWSSIAVLFNC